MRRRLRRWLRERKLVSAIVLVGLAAGLAQLLLWWMGPAPKANDFVGPPRAGYTLTDAKVWSYNLQGRQAFRLQTPRLDRREGDESLYLDAPVFELASKQPGVPDWHGHSLYGWVSKGANLVKLQGPVAMQRPAYDGMAATELVTSDVTVWPKQNRLSTDAAAQMTQGARKMSGVGLRADLDDNHLELLDDSHGSFPPRKRKS